MYFTMNGILVKKSHETEAFSVHSDSGSQMSFSFSKFDTNVVKGLAACLLLIHHLYM